MISCHPSQQCYPFFAVCLLELILWQSRKCCFLQSGKNSFRRWKTSHVEWFEGCEQQSGKHAQHIMSISRIILAKFWHICGDSWDSEWNFTFATGRMRDRWTDNEAEAKTIWQSSFDNILPYSIHAIEPCYQYWVDMVVVNKMKSLCLSPKY